jgi:hypothetical protein
MIMTKFAERYDFTGEDRPPDHDIRHERPRHNPRGHARDCRGAHIATGLAIRGEQARSAGANLDAWLRCTRLLDGR